MVVISRWLAVPTLLLKTLLQQVPSTGSQLQTQHPQALVLASGGFNHASLSAAPPTAHRTLPVTQVPAKLWT